MNMHDLGYDEWFQDKTDKEKLNGFSIARVIAVNKHNYVISNAGREIFAELSGKFIFNADSPLDYPTTGDFVYAQLFNDDSFAVIHEIVPRKSVLKRRMPGKKTDYQLVASNIDTAMIVQALDHDYNLRRLERYLVMVKDGNITPLLLLSKSDLLSQDEIEEKKTEIKRQVPDLQVIAFSNQNDAEFETVRKLFLPGKTHCLIGSSGVGKTTLLNNLLKEKIFDTQPVREKDSRGRHTTSRRELIILDNGAMFIDTPGMRELGFIGAGQAIDGSFTDIIDLMNSCRFSNCTHTKEDGCAILEALETGELSHERYNNYLKLMKESQYYQMTYAEKRKKDKDFGKMVKSVLKYSSKK